MPARLAWTKPEQTAGGPAANFIHSTYIIALANRTPLVEELSGAVGKPAVLYCTS